MTALVGVDPDQLARRYLVAVAIVVAPVLRRSVAIIVRATRAGRAAASAAPRASPSSRTTPIAD